MHQPRNAETNMDNSSYSQGIQDVLYPEIQTYLLPVQMRP